MNVFSASFISPFFADIFNVVRKFEQADLHESFEERFSREMHMSQRQWNRSFLGLILFRLSS